MASVSSSPWRLVVADMDGTLVKGTTALAHLGSWIGHPPRIEGLEAKLADGRISDREVADSYATSYEGIAVADASSAMSSIPCIDDIAEGVALLRQHSAPACMATVSWSFAARSLADLWGFADVCGADLEVDSTTACFTGRVARHFRPEDKVAFVAERCRRDGIGLDQVVAIGDSRSDLPLFEAVGYSVALNATPDAQAVASTVVTSASFLAALRAVPGLLSW